MDIQPFPEPFLFVDSTEVKSVIEKRIVNIVLKMEMEFGFDSL